MMSKVNGMLVASAILALAAGGCNVKPKVPTVENKTVEVVAVDASDAAEVGAVTELLDAQASYKQALEVLRAYYVQTGAYFKQQWSEREIDNLRKARPWEFVGVQAPPPPASQSIEDVTEAALAEQVLSARARWKAAVAALEALYRARGSGLKQALVANIRARFDPVHEYDYIVSAEVPPPTLRPTEVIPQADALYEKALDLHKRGKPLPDITSYPKQRQALGLFLQLVREHPTSTKISNSAYYIAEIYKEYFNENQRSVIWYERSWQWDQDITLPARSQAAYIYDIRLAQYGKALELYNESIKHEQTYPNRIRYSHQRIGELTAPKE